MESNVPENIKLLIPRKLHLQKNHPLSIIKQFIANVFKDFTLFDDVYPIVSTANCFDSLLIPKDHVCRNKSDTFYIDKDTVLRTQTSAHQCTLLKYGQLQFLCAGDVYRRDEIDRYHFPVFHQLEGLKVMPAGTSIEDCIIDLKMHLTTLVQKLFGECSCTWSDTYFPFTTNSLELEIDYFDRKIEVLGCGIVHNDILKSCGLEGRVAWAFGLGLERLAMILFDIPDIRLFWSTDNRFLSQFNETTGIHTKFKPFSYHAAISKDISFWIPDDVR